MVRRTYVLYPPQTVYKEWTVCFKFFLYFHVICNRSYLKHIYYEQFYSYDWIGIGGNRMSRETVGRKRKKLCNLYHSSSPSPHSFCLYSLPPSASLLPSPRPPIIESRSSAHCYVCCVFSSWHLRPSPSPFSSPLFLHPSDSPFISLIHRWSRDTNSNELLTSSIGSVSILSLLWLSHKTNKTIPTDCEKNE